MLTFEDMDVEEGKKATSASDDKKEERFEAESKRLINNKTVDANQLMPLKYKWAWEHYLNGCANNWMPTEVPMSKDSERCKFHFL